MKCLQVGHGDMSDNSRAQTMTNATNIVNEHLKNADTDNATLEKNLRYYTQIDFHPKHSANISNMISTKFIGARERSRHKNYNDDFHNSVTIDNYNITSIISKHGVMVGDSYLRQLDAPIVVELSKTHAICKLTPMTLQAIETNYSNGKNHDPVLQFQLSTKVSYMGSINKANPENQPNTVSKTYSKSLALSTLRNNLILFDFDDDYGT